MKRRSFFKLIGISTVALIAVPGFTSFSTSFQNCAINLIINEYPFLKLSREEIEHYVDDFCDKNRPNLLWQVKVKLHFYLNINSTTSVALINDFLLSTDFFSSRMDESKKITYLELYNPYKKPFSNPFSFLYYPQKDAPRL